MISRLKILHKGLLLVGAPFLLGLSIVILLSTILQQMDQALLEEGKLRKVSLALSDMTSESSDAAWSVFSCIHPRLREMAVADPREKLEESRQLTEAVIAAAKGTGELEEALKEPLAYQFVVLKHLERIVSLAPKEAMDPGALLAILPEVAKTQAAVAASTDSDLKLLDLSERLVQKSADRLASIRSSEGITLLLAAIANALLASGLYLYFRKSILERIQAVSRKVTLLSSATPLGQPEPGSDEIARLDAAFCAMDKSLREAARQETALFNNASDLIFVLDESFNFVKVNAASKVLLGRTQDKLLDTSLFAWVHKDDQQHLIQSLKQTCSAEPSGSFECRINKEDGSILETAWSVFWEACEGSWFCVVHDISVYKKLERLKSQYFSFVSRHLTVPLQKISESIDSLVKHSASFPVKAAERTVTLQTNVARLVGMSSELLQTQLFNINEKPELNYEKLDMLELMQRAAGELESIAANKKVLIQTRGSAEFDGDRGRIMQVLVNLLSNSIKYSPEEGIVDLSCRQENGTVHVSIKDQGRGVPAEFRESIFEKFKQVKAADGKRQAGTGLGLPICKQLIGWHAGKIGVKSEEKNGSDFWFEIPQHVPTKSGEIVAGEKPDEIEKTSRTEPEGTKAQGSQPPKQGSAPKQGSGEMGLTRQGLILIGVPLLFEFIFIAALGIIFLQSQAEAVMETRERNLSYAATKLWFHYRQMSLSNIVLDKPKDKISPARLLKEMKGLAAGSPARLRLIENIKNSCRSVEHSLNLVPKKHESLRAMGSFLDVGSIRETMPAQLNSLRGLLRISTLSRQIQQLLKELSKKQSRSPLRHAQIRNIQTCLLLAGLALNVLVSVALAQFFSKRITSRLIQLSDNCQRLSNEKPLNKPIGGDDEIAHLEQAFHSAASSLMEVREKERSVLVKSKEVICSLDEVGKFKKLNPAATQMWQYEPAELEERKLLELVSPGDRERVNSQLLELQSINTFEAEMTRKDGTPSYVLWSISRPEGERNVFCVAHDISAKREAEKLTNEFLHMIGHDLRTPLSSIMVITKTMEVGAYGDIPDSCLATLSEVTLECDNLLELINDLLDLEKLSAGMMQLNVGDLELGDMLERLRAAFNSRAEEKEISLKIASARGKLACDGDRLTQAISNLLDFMLNQTPVAGTIELTGRLENNTLSIRIENNAVAIPQANELFDRFKIFHLTGSLALPIAKQIIESHHGKLDFETGPNSNAFVLSVPIKQFILA